MEFCDDCDSILFLKCRSSEMEDIDSGVEAKVSTISEPELIYICKVCGFEKEIYPFDPIDKLVTLYQ